MKKHNEYSQEHILYLKKIKKRNVIITVLRFSILIVFLLLWEILERVGIIDGFLMSSPSRILATVKDLHDSGDLYRHVGATLYETLLGFFIATLSGYAVAVALWWSDGLKMVLEPYIVVLNSLPKIALGPIIIIWFGSGRKSIVFMTVLITVIVTVINLLNGFLLTEKSKILLLEAMGAKKIQILFNLVMPGSLPTLISTLKVNVGMAWIGSIMGEYLVSREGIGYLIVYGGQAFKLDLVMASTVILCVLAGAMYACIALLEKKLVNKR